MTKKSIRWGLLSTAHINRRLIPAIRASARGELVAVASRLQAAADAYAAAWEIPLAFGSYEAMLASDAINAVYIGLPNHLHAAWTIQALRQGKHVLCEKPFALTLAEADAMIAAAAETGLVLAEAFMYRHHPQMKIAGEWVRSGRLGQIRMVRGVFNYAMAPGENIRLNAAWGGGCLWDVGVYPLSLAQFMLGGAPAQVAGAQWLGPSGVDEDFAGQLWYANGAMAQIQASFRCPFYTTAEVIGTEGRLSFTRPFVFTLDPAERRLIFHPRSGPAAEIPAPEEELYAGEVADMHAAILDGAAPYLSLAETRDHVRTVLALYESARQNRIISLSAPL